MQESPLDYLAARISQYGGGGSRSGMAMASLVSPSFALTTSHALPVAVSDVDYRVPLEFPRITTEREGMVVEYDGGLDFAVIQLDPPLQVPLNVPAVSADIPGHGTRWETLCITPSEPAGRLVAGRVDKIEIVEGRTLLKLSVESPPADPRGVSGAPVMVEGKIVAIVWGRQESESSEHSGEERAETWYAIPFSEMIKSTNTHILRGLLSEPEQPTSEGPVHSSASGPQPASRGKSVSEMLAQLRDGDNLVRAVTVRAFKERARSDLRVRAAVTERLFDEDAAVRAAAVAALSELASSDPELAAAIMTCLEDENANVRTEAVKALGGMARDDRIRAALTARLEDENASVRAEAAAALGAAGHDSQLAVDVAESANRGSDDRQVAHETIQSAPQSPEIDPIAFFRRLSPSSRRALSHAVGIGRHLMRKALPTSQREEAIVEQLEKLPMNLVVLLAGLYEYEEGPTRRLFSSRNIDGSRFAELIEEVPNEVPLPSRAEYSPVALDGLPSLNPASQRALQVARDIADRMGAAQIQSRHLLYGILSIKDNELVNLLAEAGIHQEDVTLVETEAIAIPVPKSIAFLSADTSAGEDLLGFEADVNALSAIIAAKAVDPPLSIGLFGDWGSGKSFFMGKMDANIRNLTKIERASKGNSAYCSNIVQIWFNAWSYVETDLWASLVTDIFEELARAIEKDEELAGGASAATAKARLLAAMASARDVVAEEVRRRDAAKDELNAVEEHVADLKVTGEELQRRLGPKELLKDAYRVVAKEPSVNAQLADAARRLNIPEAQRAASELKASLLEIKGLWSALGFALKGWKSTTAWLLGFGTLIAVFGFLWGLLPWALKVDLGSKVAGAASLFLSAAIWLAPFLKKANVGLTIVSSIKQQQQQRINEERTKIEKQSKKQQESVRQRLSEAEERVQIAKAEIGRLEQTLKEMRADKQLLTFIRERSLSTDYTSRLGTVARARRDFKQLSELMDRVRNQNKDGAEGGSNGDVDQLSLPRVDRIVLYIDDLDRCSEDRVVKVLEAVHLLLAFRLFVVIVAVDSRWLLRSLRQHSAAFQSSNEGGAGISDEELAHWESTPLNYLEKIFQIPFYLKPMRERGFSRLVDSIVGKVVSDTEEQTRADKNTPDNLRDDDAPGLTGTTREGVTDATPQRAADPKSETRVIVPAEGVSAITARESSEATAAPSQLVGIRKQVATPTVSEHYSVSEQHSVTIQPSPEEANPAALQLREWERDFMKRLHPLIISPRSTKRFVNTYRLMRVSITEQTELTAFVGDEHGGQHRAALLLLAILTGYPAEATDILRDLLEKERPETWWQYIDSVEASWKRVWIEDAKTKTPRPSTGSRVLSYRRRDELMSKLRLLRSEIPETQSCDHFVKWASKVAKYSFESGRVLMLLSDEVEAD